MKILSYLVALVALAVVGCQTGETPIQPGTASNPSMDKTTVTKGKFVNMIFWNECCGETVAVSGTYHVTMSEDPETGDTRAHGTWSNMKGVGAITGKTYVMHDNYKAEQDGTPPFACPAEANFIDRFRMTSTGSGGGCSFTAVVTIHFSWDADCNLEFGILNIETECK